MADAQYMPGSIALDASWDHAMLSDEDAMWLQQQQEHDLAHEWLSDFPTAQDIQETENYCDEEESNGSPRNVDFMLQQHYDHEEPERDAYEEYFANLDTTNMSKAELRKHKNRASAARSRQRTRERMEQLERLVCELAAKNRHLEQTLNAMHFHQLAMAGVHPGVVAVPHGFVPTDMNHEMM